MVLERGNEFKLGSKVLLGAFGLYSIFLLLCGLLPPLLILLNHREIANEAYVFLAQACHQNPLRSFWYWGYPMALCGRCIGVYAGSVLGVTLLLFRVKSFATLSFCVVLMILGFADKLLEWAHLDFYASFMFNHLTLETSLRCLLGVMFGLGLSGVIGYLGNFLTKLFSKLNVSH